MSKHDTNIRKHQTNIKTHDAPHDGFNKRSKRAQPEETITCLRVDGKLRGEGLR